MMTAKGAYNYAKIEIKLLNKDDEIYVYHTQYISYNYNVYRVNFLSL